MVGAGLAGLAAARRLGDREVAVTVLEARERVGGRVWSTTLANGAIVELGAEWIMPGDRAVRAVAERFDLALAATGTDYLRREPWGLDSASLADQDRFLASARTARGCLPAADVSRMSLGRFLAAVPGSDSARAIVTTRLTGTCASDPHDVALRAVEAEDFAAPAASYIRLAEGNQRLAEALAGSLADVRTGQVVDGVAVHDGEVDVRVGDHLERADAIVVAVPAPIAARLSFEPALPPPLMDTLASLPMGVASKLAAAIHGSAAARSLQHPAIATWCWVANGVDGKPRACLTAFAGSSEALAALETGSGRAMRWFDLLRDMNPDLQFDGEPVMYTWADDPFTLGAYSAWDNASFDRLPRLQEPVGRVVFAGEHTAGPHNHGTMNGALLSGERAADQILALLG